MSRRRVMMLDPSMGLAAVMALTLATRNFKPRPITPEQSAAADKRTEREKWNDEVEQRKAEKLAKKVTP